MFFLLHSTGQMYFGKRMEIFNKTKMLMNVLL